MPGFRIDVVARLRQPGDFNLPTGANSEERYKINSQLKYMEADLGAATMGCTAIGFASKFDILESGADVVKYNRYRALAKWQPLEDEVGVIFTEDDAATQSIEQRPRTVERRLFETGRDMIGLGPKIARNGDVVVFLFGGSYPLVLRPKWNGRWRLVGDAYTYDVSEGNIIEEWEAGGQEPEVFKIY